MKVFHIVDADEWQRAVAAGTYRPASVAAEGFIHFSYRDQVAATANRYYRDYDNLIVVAVDLTGVPDEVRVEPSPATGENFPHLYGELPTSHAYATYPLRRNADGDYTFSGDAVSSDV